MNALDTSLAALIKAHNLQNCGITLLNSASSYDVFYSVSLQWNGDDGNLDGVIEHGKSSSDALKKALAAMAAKRTVALAGELA